MNLNELLIEFLNELLNEFKGFCLILGIQSVLESKELHKENFNEVSNQRKSFRLKEV